MAPIRCALPNKSVVDGLKKWSLHKNITLYTDHDDSEEDEILMDKPSEEKSVEFFEMTDINYSYNDLINTLADQSVKVLRQKCDESIPLTETSLRRKPVNS